MVNSQVKKAWKAYFKQGNGLCKDFLVGKSRTIERRSTEGAERVFALVELRV